MKRKLKIREQVELARDKAVLKVLQDFVNYGYSCPLISLAGNAKFPPADCTLNNGKCNGCSIARQIISVNVAEYAKLAALMDEKKYLSLAKIFRSCNECFDKGLKKSDLYLTKEQK